jgi:hypothetical protein
MSILLSSSPAPALLPSRVTFEFACNEPSACEGRTYTAQ